MAERYDLKLFSRGFSFVFLCGFVYIYMQQKKILLVLFVLSEIPNSKIANLNPDIENCLNYLFL